MRLGNSLLVLVAASLLACNPPVPPGDVDAGCGGSGEPCCADSYCGPGLTCGGCTQPNLCAPVEEVCDAGPGDAGQDAGQDGGSDAGGDAGVCVTAPPTASIIVMQGMMMVDPTTFTFAPFKGVTLVGAATGTDGLAASYEWEIVSQPEGANASFVDSGGVVSFAARGTQVTFATSAPGEYVIGMAATAGACTSAEAMVTLQVTLPGTLYIMLTWAEPYGDMDLHYIGPGGSFYEEMPYEGDLDWTYAFGNLYGPGIPTPTGATSPDWGLNNTVAPDNISSDDPAMLVDQRFGNGPEIASHPAPFAGTYKLVVHYYCAENELTDGPNLGPATPTIQVFVDGAPVWSATGPSMVEDQVWEAAELDVADGGSISLVPESAPLYFGNQGCMESENAPPDGGA